MDVVGERASTSALIADGRVPGAAGFAAALAPNGLVMAGTGWLELANVGASSARGMA
jgi:hypothetical protein